jgi:hypothetical protein
MAVFEREGDGALDSKWYERMDRNWNSGNLEIAAILRRMAEMGETDYPGSNEVTQARVGVNGTNYDSLNGRLDDNELEVQNARGVYQNLALHETNQDNDIQTNAAKIINASSSAAYAVNLAKQAASGSPRGTFSSESELKAAFPNGISGIWVTSNNGHWWFYSAGWIDGGQYQAASIADRSILPSKLAALSLDLPVFQFQSPVEFNTINRRLSFPAGNMILNGHWLSLDAQTMSYEDPEDSHNLMVYYNLASKSYTYHWPTSQNEIDENNEVFVCHADPINHTLYINAPSIVNGRGVLYESPELLTPLVAKGLLL